MTNLPSFKSFRTPFNPKQPYNKMPCVITGIRFKQSLQIPFPKRWHSLVFLNRSCIRPQQLDPLAVVEDWDVPCAHLQPQTQLVVADAESAKVGLTGTTRNNLMFANNLAVHNKTWKHKYIVWVYRCFSWFSLFRRMRPDSPDLTLGQWPGWKWFPVCHRCWSTEILLSPAVRSGSEGLHRLDKHQWNI